MARITNDLLKQAIADAEAVRETAVANAKLVLEEAITPQIREMIALRLREAATEKPHEEGEAEGGKDFPADSSEVGKGDNKAPSGDSFDTSGVGTGPENAGTSDDDWYEDWSESDFDLNEVIAELESDILELSNNDDFLNKTDHMGRSTTHTDGNMRTNPVLASDGVDPDTDADMSDGGSLEDLLRELEDEEDEDEDDMNDHGDMEDMDDQEDHGDMEDMEDMDEMFIDLEEILAEIDADDDDGEDKDDEEERHHAEKKQMATEIAHLRRQLAEHKSALNTVSFKLNEVNLLNAKLLFTNKMFRKNGLSNNQKVRIVESFDRATTVREVKLVYTALMENLNVSANTASSSRKKIVAEGIASKATPSTAPNKGVIVENAVAKRLQELAGLI
jgi:hypothetical protein